MSKGMGAVIGSGSWAKRRNGEMAEGFNIKIESTDADAGTEPSLPSAISPPHSGP